jgi:phosphomevalonate kinase
VRVLAPGKVFLFGEYAVLEGAPALVMAVTRYARARRTSGEVVEIASLLREAATECLPPLPSPLSFAVDSSELTVSGKKLGLGSSAAACVAGAALWYHEAGLSLASDRVRHGIFQAARRAHERLQGEILSGADIAASVEGGLIRYEMGGSGRWESARLPIRLRLLFVHTGFPASTRVLVGRVRELRQSQPALYHRRLNVLGDLAAGLGPDPSEHTAGEFCLMVHSYLAHLDALGRDCGVPIVSEPHQRIAKIARSCGCAAKPSGAGGGDLAVAFCPDAASAARLREELMAQDFAPLDLEMDLTGVRVEPDAQQPS